MNLKMLTVGSVSTNCYVVWCSNTGEAVVIDPGFDREGEGERVLGVLKENRLKVKFIVDTHGHSDHIRGNGVVKNATGAPILIHKADANMLSQVGRNPLASFGSLEVSPAADGFLEDADVLRFGKVALQVLHTPGHSPGSISLVGENCVFTGDTLFAGSIGRVDLPGGSGKAIMQSLREKLAALPERIIVYPGHGPKSTIGEEKRSNPFLRGNFNIPI